MACTKLSLCSRWSWSTAVVTASATGQILQRYTYDGFDRVTQHTKSSGTSTTTTTRYSYDPLDRTATKTDNAGATGEKATVFDYLGLSGDVIAERDQVSGQLQRSYQYSPWGERLSQTKFTTGGTSEDSFYSYNPHSDVETLTDQNGDTRATYGYTAYGQNDDTSFTGVDKPDAQNPTKEPYNFYRFNAKRFDPASGTYDMGFRDYDPGLNRFLTRDAYNGALGDLDLATDPFTGNRYAFAGGNPISNIELDGHAVTPENPVTANPKLNQWLNTVWSPAHPYTGCDCAGLEEEVKAATGGLTPEQERARAAYTGELGPSLRDPRWCYEHSVGNVSACQLVDAAGTVADQATPYLELAAGLLGATDIERCAEKAVVSSCALAAASILPIGKVGKGAAVARTAAARALKYGGRLFPDYEEGSHLVYVLTKDRSPVRVGISQLGNPFAKRMGDEARQYHGRFDDYHVLITGVTKTQARAIETHLLQNYKPYLPLNDADRSMSLPIYRKFIPWVESVINDWFSFGPS